MDWWEGSYPDCTIHISISHGSTVVEQWVSVHYIIRIHVRLCLQYCARGTDCSVRMEWGPEILKLLKNAIHLPSAVHAATLVQRIYAILHQLPKLWVVVA